MQERITFIKSPLNYIGGKYRLLPQILPYFPKKIDTFVDLFCGGGNVGVNVTCNRIIYNDTNSMLINLFKVFYELDKDIVFAKINEIITKYHLSQSGKDSYSYYNCDSVSGLGKYNKAKYIKLRQDFNAVCDSKNKDFDYYLMLFVLIVYAFNNQIRFNSSGDFNLPVGKRDFNAHIQKNLSNFLDKLKLQKPKFTQLDFRNFDINQLSKNDFVYMDPPYLITCATYNEQGGWTEKDEVDLLAFIDVLHKHKIKFALSNVLNSKGKTNEILQGWTKKHSRQYRVIHLDYNYANSNYHTKDRTLNSDEVLIINSKGD